MSKEQYFKDLEEIIHDVIYIGSSDSELQKEIETNMWCISISEEISNEVNLSDFSAFIMNVIANRQNQINHSNKQSGLIFYLWFDFMASQLRFNLISDSNKELPFRCKIQNVSEPDEIIDLFLKSNVYDEITQDTDTNENDTDNEYVLKVYTQYLDKQ
ncbi:hypothetical protein C161_08173 [Paenibacillus sp. FSL R5-192]|uniref:hypothetical protein n=1 Tax=Paenibacillus sp. FSL R5-192 TaxID=1226754 RepID=UPI0003E23A92|nr:hypothetical protein [Paenibacillus sp. FSL R5-192]ETT38085.1 hypothetical protein C161_08173 [Paenibacillus sp. FSL R5-192]